MTGSATSVSCGTIETVMCMVVAVVVIRTEVMRYWTPRLGRSRGIGRWAPGEYISEMIELAREHYAPEVGAMWACLAVALVLRLHGDARAPTDEDAYAAWARIKAEWPVLMGADTLLALQAIFRLGVLTCVVYRTTRPGKISSSPVPLCDEAATLWLGAALARVALLCRSSAYQLDGPLGGWVPAACEIGVLPPLVVLALPTLRKAPITMCFTAVATFVFALRNHLSLTGNYVTDSLFTLAHSYDVLAACVYLLRTLLIDSVRQQVHSSIATVFAHIVMPVQAALAAYYFLTAFDAVPELVGAGVPFQVLKFGTGVQFGAYTAAALIYFADRAETAAQLAREAGPSRDM